MGNTYRLKSSIYGNNTTYFLSPIKICSFAAIFHFNVTEKDQRARKGNIGAATNGLEGPGGFTGWCLFHLSTSRWRGRKEKLMSNTGGGGGSVAKSCLTLATPWTVARQAPLSMDSPGKNTGVGCHSSFHNALHIFKSKYLRLCETQKNIRIVLLDTHLYGFS